MFFLKDKYTLGYKYGQPTFYGTKHLGQDYIVPSGTKIYAPFNGTVTKTVYGTEGGYTTFFQPDGKNVTYRFLHLSKQIVLAGGHVNEGELIALSGNTGTETTAPHVHFDCFTGNILPVLIFTNFIDPTTINWIDMETLKITVVDNSGYADMLTQIQQYANMSKLWSNNRLMIEFHLVFTSFTDIPLQDLGNGFLIPDQQWMRDNIYQFRGDADAILFITLPLGTPGEQGYMIDPSVTGEPFVLFVDTNVSASFKQQYGYTEVTKLALHEQSHCLYHLTGQLDTTHPYDFQNPSNLQGAYQTLDYGLLSANLALRRQQRNKEGMIIIHKKSDINTKFVLENEMKRGYADFPAFQKDITGRLVIELALDDVEFNKIPLSQAVIKS